MKKGDDLCYICDSGENTHLLLVCDECKYFCCHTYCLDPPLNYIPEGDWICTYCQRERDNSHSFSFNMGNFFHRNNRNNPNSGNPRSTNVARNNNRGRAANNGRRGGNTNNRRRRMLLGNEHFGQLNMNQGPYLTRNELKQERNNVGDIQGNLREYSGNEPRSRFEILGRSYCLRSVD